MEGKHPWSFTFIKVFLIIGTVKLVFGPLAFVSKLFPSKLPPGITKKEIKVNSREPGRKIKVHVYKPDLNGEEDDSSLPPVHLHFHGSGYVILSHGSDGEFCSYLSKRLRAVVLDCDYRKFPCPFPAAYHDCLDLIKWCSEQEDQWDINKITIGGKSAGGALALSASSTFPEIIKACASLCPPTDFRRPESNLRFTKPSVSTDYQSGMPLTFAMVNLCDDAYILETTDRQDPKLSTILAKARDFPKAVWVGTGTADILYTEGKEFIANLQNDGHPNAVFMSVEKEGHAWDGFAKKGSPSEKKKEEAYDAICQTIQSGWKV